MSLSGSLRDLPAVDAILRSESAAKLIEAYGRDLSTTAIRSAIDDARQAILAGSPVPMEREIVASAADLAELALGEPLQEVINATGVVIHTNLGRAPLPEQALKEISNSLHGYLNLEFDLTSGKRGSRSIFVRSLLQRLSGAEDGLAVNNNAAAVLLALAALCRGGEVLISRGELVEIGGGFRVPDVMAESGARLVEVGTTNRTRASDYSKAITEQTKAILIVHQSNFTMFGFTEQPSIAELRVVADDFGLLLIHDLGSGVLLDSTSFGLGKEPTVSEVLAEGVDLVTFSGDKLLGGPQAGLICGRSDLVEACRRHPLARAVRADKLALVALAETLKIYATGSAVESIPIWAMINLSIEELDSIATEWAGEIERAGCSAVVVDGASTVGGGSLPGETLPTRLVAITCESAEDLSQRLRAAQPPIVARVKENRLLLDPRTVLPGQREALLTGLLDAVGEM